MSCQRLFFIISSFVASEKLCFETVAFPRYLYLYFLSAKLDNEMHIQLPAFTGSWDAFKSLIPSDNNFVSSAENAGGSAVVSAHACFFVVFVYC